MGNIYKLVMVANIFFAYELVFTSAYREFEASGVKTILSLKNETVNIRCEADTQMAYCGFIHPTGKRYSVPGSDLMDGHCSIQINATEKDTGIWKCHIGKVASGVEIHQRILLRVVSEVAAIRPNITAVHGREVTLECATTKEYVPLVYCRFEPPQAEPFSINSDVTRDKAVLNKYYFPQNRSLDRGDCAVTIRRVKYDDFGVWTCGAGFYDGKEYIDVISLEVEGLYTLSTASATWSTVAGVAIAVVCLIILGFVAWKKRSVLGSGRAPEEIEVQDLGPEAVSQQRSAQTTPQRTPQGSPRAGWPIPSVVIQSPSVSPEVAPSA